MKKIILVLCLLLLPIALALPNHYYKLELNYNQGNLSYSTVKVELSSKDVEIYGSDYVVNVIGFDNQSLNTTYFSFPLTVYYDFIDSETGSITDGGSTELNETNLTLYVPYYKNAKQIEVYDDEFYQKLIINVESFSQESTKPIVKSEVEEKKETIAVSSEKEINQSKQNWQAELIKAEKIIKKIPKNKWVMIGIGLFVLILIIVLLSLKKKNN